MKARAPSQLPPNLLSLASAVNPCFLPSLARWSSSTPNSEAGPSRPSATQRKRQQHLQYASHGPGYISARAPPTAEWLHRRLAALPVVKDGESDPLTLDNWASVCQDPLVTLQEVVNMMERGAASTDQVTQWPVWFLNSALGRKTDFDSLLRFLPFLLQEFDRISTLRKATLLRSAIRAMGRFNMLAAITTLVDRFLNSSIHPKDPAVADTTRPLPIVALVKALAGIGSSAFQTPQGCLSNRLSPQHRAIISNMILRLLLHHLSLSSSRGRLPAEILPVLLNSSVITSKLRGIVLKEVQKQGLQLSSHQLRVAFTSAVHERDEAGAKELWIEMNAQDVDPDVPPSELEDKQVLGILMLAWAQGSYSSVTAVAADLNLISPYEIAKDDYDKWHPPPKGLNPTRIFRTMEATRAAHDNQIRADDLIKLAKRQAGQTVDRRALTSVMRGLSMRGDHSRAWQVWEAMTSRETTRIEAGSLQPEVDHVAVTVIADSLGAQGKVDEAITLVDSWARRPWQRVPKDSANLLVIDTTTVNILLQACGTARKSRLAFRIWKAMLPRWGVYHDAISLTLLLKAANVEQAEVGRRGILAEGRELFTDGIRDLSSSFRDPESQDDAYEAYEASGFAKGPVSVLLDSDDASYKSSRRATYYSRKKARGLFRSVVFNNWPDLVKVKSPLKSAGAWSALNNLVHPTGSVSPAPHASLVKTPTASARYTHVIPDSATFSGFISILASLELFHEIPLALAWMRALSIAPSYNLMCKALLIVGESSGPKRYINGRWARDEELLREYLQEWLEADLDEGEKAVPNEEDIAAMVRSRSAAYSQP